MKLTEGVSDEVQAPELEGLFWGSAGAPQARANNAGWGENAGVDEETHLDLVR